MSAKLVLGDCLDALKSVPSGSVDMVLADLPYGTTACNWDDVLDLAVLWAQYERVVKETGAICLFASQPFTTDLINSNRRSYRYSWYWYKNTPTGMAFAKTQPMRVLEDIAVFYRSQPTFHPQLVETKISDRKVTEGARNGRTQPGDHHPGFKSVPIVLKQKVNPRNVLEFKSVPNASGRLHPTQKPIDLLEYLIKTYTNEGETVLDNTMGSGSTGVACAITGRKFIGIEKDPKYFEIAGKRIFAAFPPFVKQVQESDSEG